MMTSEMFEQTLRSLVHQQPFQPFLIEMVEEQKVLVVRPDKLAFGGGGASYVDEGEIHLVDCESVLEIRPVNLKASS